MPQLSFASLTPKIKNIRSETFLKEMQQIVPWNEIIRVIEPFYPKKGNGRQPYDLQLMIKIYCLQQWFSLSDPLAEETIYDRLSFQRFLNLDLMLNKIPDETTILNFRHLLEQHQLQVKIFFYISKHLQEKGLYMKKGTIVDATIVESPSSTKNNDKKRSPEMSSTKKGGKYYYGMKAHIGTDSRNGIVHSVEITTAKVSDKIMLPSLLHGEESAVFGDKGYYCEKDKKYARDAEVFWGVLEKRKPKRKLSSKQKRKNKLLSSIRSKVEYPFRIIKNLWGHKRTRYRGLERNSCHWNMLFALTNLYLVRKKLLLQH